MTEPTTTAVPDEPTPAAKPNGSPAPAPERSANDFEMRMRTDPDFAIGEVKKYQRKQAEFQQRMKPLESLEGVAKAVGNGDISAGLQKIIGLADRAYRIEQNPDWSRTVDDLMAGRRPATREVGEPAAEADEYLTPEERKIRALETELGQIRGRLESHDSRSARREMQSHLESFFGSEIGQALDGDERSELVEAIGKQFDAWGRSDQGRSVMSNLSIDTIETIALKHLKDRGILLTVSERLHSAKQNRLAGAATDSPSLGSRAASPDHPAFKSAKEALEWAAQKYLPPEDRQSLKW